MKTKMILVSMVGLMAVAQISGAQTVITFDDISNDGTPAAMPSGYAGMQWSGFSVVNAVLNQELPYPNASFANGLVSFDNVALTVSSSSISDSTSPFIFNSGYFTSEFSAGYTLVITGINGGTQGYSDSFIINPNTPSFISGLFNTPVTEVDFSTSYYGSAINPEDVPPPGGGFVLDNLSVTAVPEPSTGLMFSTGMRILGWVLRKRRG